MRRTRAQLARCRFIVLLAGAVTTGLVIGGVAGVIPGLIGRHWPFAVLVVAAGVAWVESAS